MISVIRQSLNICISLEHRPFVFQISKLPRYLYIILFSIFIHINTDKLTSCFTYFFIEIIIINMRIVLRLGFTKHNKFSVYSFTQNMLKLFYSVNSSLKCIGKSLNTVKITKFKSQYDYCNLKNLY